MPNVTIITRIITRIIIKIILTIALTAANDLINMEKQLTDYTEIIECECFSIALSIKRYAYSAYRIMVFIDRI